VDDRDRSSVFDDRFVRGGEPLEHIDHDPDGDVGREWTILDASWSTR
jgi:hypothetical protein